MSLEAAIQENTKALQALHALLSAGKPAFDVEAATAAAKAKTQAAFDKRVKKPEAPAATEQSTAEVKSAESTAETPQADASAPIDYQKDVVPKALAVAKKLQREGLRKLLDQFEVPADKTAQALKAEQYADFIKACDKALA